MKHYHGLIKFLAGRQHDKSNCTFAEIDLLSMIMMKLRSLVTKSNTNRLIRTW